MSEDNLSFDEKFPDAVKQCSCGGPIYFHESDYCEACHDAAAAAARTDDY